jgi:hypothetical protein
LPGATGHKNGHQNGQAKRETGHWLLHRMHGFNRPPERDGLAFSSFLQRIERISTTRLRKRFHTFASPNRSASTGPRSSPTPLRYQIVPANAVVQRQRDSAVRCSRLLARAIG